MEHFIFTITIGVILNIGAMYMIAICMPLLMARKLNLKQSMEDIYSTEPHGKILIFSIFIFATYWLTIGQNYVQDFDIDSWFPLIFYFIIYSLSYYAAQIDKGKKTYLQRALDGENTDFNERPNFYNQFLGQCFVILALVAYELYLIIFN
tara:strand:+ start:45 stop:494 length:450 start_codon:yes stop_codon:yes gene_type:complete